MSLELVKAIMNPDFKLESSDTLVGFTHIPELGRVNLDAVFDGSSGAAVSFDLSARDVVRLHSYLGDVINRGV